MKLRKVSREEARIVVRVSPEEVPVRGNAVASGDDAEDKAAEDEIIARLNDGDTEAWCTILVQAKWHGWEGVASLGCVSLSPDVSSSDYANEEGMIEEALDSLNRELSNSFAQLKELLA